MTKTILLVEDNPDDEMLTLRTLRKYMHHHEIKVTRDGAEALDFIFQTGDYQGLTRSSIPTLVLLELRLPKVNGLEVLRRIKGNVGTCCIPTIIFSSSTEGNDISDSYRLGANGYISKPVNYDHYTDTLKHVMTYWLGLNVPIPGCRISAPNAPFRLSVDSPHATAGKGYPLGSEDYPANSFLSSPTAGT